jgi:hypothetical protein
MASRARRAAAAPAAAMGAHVWFAGREDDELGVYLRPDTPWPDDRYVDSLGATAQIALDMARRHPDGGDVEVCQDAVWLPHDKAHPFVPGTRVTVHRAKLGLLPARLTSAADVIKAVSTGAIELIIEPRLVQTDAYRRAVAGTVPPPAG